MAALRRKWLSEFQKVFGTKTAVRLMPIDRRLSRAHQFRFMAKTLLAQ